jgi:hypothetical protein
VRVAVREINPAVRCWRAPPKKKRMKLLWPKEPHGADLWVQASHEHPAAGSSRPNGWISLSNECQRLMYAKVELDKKLSTPSEFSLAAAPLVLIYTKQHTRGEKAENEPQDTVFMHTRNGAVGQKKKTIPPPEGREK